METVHEGDVDAETTERGDVAFERRQLGDATDAEGLGCSRYEIPPGKRAWPYHYHSANEEAVYVLAGTGEMRGPGDEWVDLEPGTFASLPPGPDGAHQIANTGEELLAYLAISTMRDPDVLVYPDSEKIGVVAGQPPGGDSDERHVDAYFRRGDAVDYWDGEE